MEALESSSSFLLSSLLSSSSLRALKERARRSLPLRPLLRPMPDADFEEDSRRAARSLSSRDMRFSEGLNMLPWERGEGRGSL